jgi:L-lactate dehydrogenase (cytochrome)
VWFQLYQVGGRAAAEDALQRARAAGYSALVVTIDTPVAGLRERDARNGTTQLLGTSPLAKLPYLPQLLLKPRWLARFLLDGGVPRLPNVNVPGQGPMRLMDVNAALSRTALSWDDFRWIRELWNGPIVVKGVLCADDARRAVDVGAVAVVVSNHGGRQLDGAPATLRVLPEIAAAVGNRIEVLVDGGVRRGSDIVKAICLGARAVLVGRAYAYGLAAAGGAGVTRALTILKTDLARTLRLIGCSSIAALRREYVEAASSPTSGTPPESLRPLPESGR